MFENIYGNRGVIENLKNSIENDRVSHCYLFHGPKGIGKRTIAKAFAKAIQCESRVIRPCGVCQSCIQVENEDHPDVIYVGHDKPNTFGVDDIRDGLNRSIVIKPYKSEKKIYILDDAELLNPQAQNAMLKTIEEPPSYGIIFLLSDNKDSFLPTILSRCVELDMKPVKDSALIKYLQDNGLYDVSNINFAVHIAQGNIGVAKAYLSEDATREMYDKVIRIMSELPRMEIKDIRKSVDELTEYKDRMSSIIGIMQVWFADLLKVKATGEVDNTLYYSNVLEKQAKRISYERFPVIFSEIDRFRMRLKVNVNNELSLEMLLLAMQE